ncbi:unnamed protein product [Sphenostylis stenocarpa]|uniref:Uncharacterized protein n=1 Tax=Sphenostylis stenocarpa TaxID=92480 RepID=A0AA86TB49_9FABA|nr:unnamed protein product [Sphenostylis stenocarpa]
MALRINQIDHVIDCQKNMAEVLDIIMNGERLRVSFWYIFLSSAFGFGYACIYPNDIDLLKRKQKGKVLQLLSYKDRSCWK